MDMLQLAGAGATALVAEMVRSGWESVREAVLRFFRKGGEAAAEEEVRLVDAGRQRLADSAESDRDAVAEQLQRDLTIQLAAFLQKHPQAADELQALVDGAQQDGDGAQPHLAANNNSNSQVIITGGSLSAGGGFHYHPPEREK
ncbi:hypothetical protein [Streptomyces alboflavus]|uniref:hypothetical protein n=1 Tax=Streptomyces alboflavus TaxID=67267 RepID=UPI0012FF5A63|nr:hypothetical protein [Streptomyces alboflavus]